MSRLRGYQSLVRDQAYAEFQRGAQCVLAVLPTGAGKTVIMGDIARNYEGIGCAVVHRSELVGQISLALAKEGVPHNLMVPPKTVKIITRKHMDKFKRHFYNQRAKWTVASVDTLIRRDASEPWFRQVGALMGDEFHHFLRDNKWGRAVDMFPNARTFGVTATPERADGKGQGRHADGFVDAMVVGPDMKWMIDEGFLTNFHIRGIMPSDLDLSNVHISNATGDFNVDEVREAVKKSNKIVGDVVDTYCTNAWGKLGVTFAVDVEHAYTIAAAYNERGVKAAVIHAKTPDDERDETLRKFERREYWQLVNVDLFGEGFDLPAIECVSFARPTASYPLYVQQFGRALRLMISDILQGAWDTFTALQRRMHIAESTKPVALIFDHVGNVLYHKGPPTMRVRPWSLDRRDKKARKKDDGIPLRLCLNLICQQPYERSYPKCPYCGMEPAPPADRTKPENVDGDLTLYDEAFLKTLYDAVKKMDGDFVAVPLDADLGLRAAIYNRADRNKEAQRKLRDMMRLMLPQGADERYNMRRFFLLFGVDVVQAQALPASEADALRERIESVLSGVN